jgi:hypothetical protein
LAGDAKPDLAELVGDASRQAVVSIMDLCLCEGVDALVIAGICAGDQTSMKTARFLATDDPPSSGRYPGFQDPRQP